MREVFTSLVLCLAVWIAGCGTDIYTIACEATDNGACLQGSVETPQTNPLYDEWQAPSWDPVRLERGETVHQFIFVPAGSVLTDVSVAIDPEVTDPTSDPMVLKDVLPGTLSLWRMPQADPRDLSLLGAVADHRPHDGPHELRISCLGEAFDPAHNVYLLKYEHETGGWAVAATVHAATTLHVPAL